MAKQVEQVHDVVICFAGDSGDGMQLTGGRFTARRRASSRPATSTREIRAPAGSLPGVWSRSTSPTTTSFTPGDRPDVLVAMNPPRSARTSTTCRRAGR